MDATRAANATLRIPGGPCIAIGSHQRAVWQCDDITILSRIGRRYLCRVVYGATGFKFAFYTWLPKKWLRCSPQQQGVEL